MKYLNILLIIAFFGLFACKTKENASGDTTGDAKSSTKNGVIKGMLSKTFDANDTGDNFTVEGARMEGNLLMVDVKYSGGCKKHEFWATGSEAIAKSLPPIRSIVIKHNANEDHCRALIMQTLMIDATDFAYQKEAGSEIFLVVNGIQKKVSYKYVK